MATDDLKEYVEDRLLAYDPDIDLSEGGPAQEQVVDPIVRRYQPDPFELDVDAFIEARLKQEYPSTSFREGTGVRDLLVKPNTVLMDPLYREGLLVKQGQSLANPDILAPTEADSLVANLFISRQTGGLASGQVRLYFNAPMALNISVGNVCYTSSGLRFIPTTLQSISAEAMLFNQSGSLFYFDINVTAEDYGTSYNVEKGDIVGITNLNTAVRVENLEDFEGGLDEETTEELVARAESSVTERSLVTGLGVEARLYEQYEDLSHLQIVGMYDEYMDRDVITGGDYGPVLNSSADGYTEDDGDGDATTASFKVRSSNFASIFGATGSVENYYLTYAETLYGEDGEVLVSDLSHFRVSSFIGGAGFVPGDVGGTIASFGGNAANAGIAVIEAVIDESTVKLDRAGVAETGINWVFSRPAKDVEIDSVLATDELKLKEELPIDLQYVTWGIRKKEITISDIPGGILFNDADIAIQSDEVHIGGCTDFYVRGSAVSEEELVIEAVSDASPIVRDLTGSTDNTNVEFFRDTTKNFVALGVEPGYSLVIEDGADAGTKQILQVGVDPSGSDDTSYLQVSPDITVTLSDLRYKIVDDIDVSLNQPKTVRGEGTDLETLQLGGIVTTTSAVDFLSLGTEEEDILEIFDGNDIGTYAIAAISGTNNRNLELSALMSATDSNISWQVYKSQDGINFPLVRIRSIDLLDSSSQPTGFTIPYADPIDARGTAFSNAGRGVKVSTSDAIMGIVGTEDLDGLSYPLAATVITVGVNGATGTAITLTGATGKTDLLNKINAVIPNIAGTIDVDGADHLAIRSGDRWLVVEAAAANANIGLDAAGEDNRQIKSAGNISDWTSSGYDLRAERDVVQVLTGDNIGNMYLVGIESGRLLVVGFDEDAGRTRFLLPNTNIKITAGSRSYGKARVYFLEPTSFQARGAWRPALKNTDDFPANKAVGSSFSLDEKERTHFTATVSGVELRFFPDPDLNHTVLPSGTDDPPNNLATDGSTVVETQGAGEPTTLGKNSRDSQVDFLTEEIRSGDLIGIPYQPIQSDVDLDGLSFPAAISGKTMIFSIDGGPFKTLTFTDEETSKERMVEAINDFAGEDIAYVEDLVASGKFLRLEADFEFTLRKDSTAIYDGGAVLWSAAFASNATNQANAASDTYYVVEGVGNPTDPTEHNKLVLSTSPVAGEAQHFQVLRPGVQRIGATDMNSNTELGMYYMDVELVSDGSGDAWNLDNDQVFVVTGHESDGYRLEVLDTDLSFSAEEEVNIVFTRRINTVGTSDKPSAATQIHDQNVQINYDRSPITNSIQLFASSELERVLNASVLVRHLLPSYINLSLNYRGGSAAAVILDDVEAFLATLAPTDRVESSDIANLPQKRGADYVEQPIDLVAIAHDRERKITVDRSKDYVTKGDLSTFFAGVISVTRELNTTL